MRRQTQFILGAVAGLLTAGVIVGLFATALSSFPLADAVVSSMTFLGLALALGGYLAHRQGHQSSVANFAFGFGIGMILVAFFGAGAGTLSFGL